MNSFLFNIGIVNKDMTRPTRYAACFGLEMEYAGEASVIDENNIKESIKVDKSQNRLIQMSTYFNFFKRVNHIENPTYVRPPVRYFRDSKGKEPKPKVLAQIKKHYDDLDVPLRYLEWDRKSARVGLIAVTVQTDPDTNRLYPVVMSPDYPSFDVTPSDRIPTIPKYLWYESLVDKKKVKHFWTPTQYIAKYADNSQTDLIAQEDHEFEGVPFAILRSTTDITKFWGPYDNSSLSISKRRSHLLADSVLRTQEFELLTAANFSAEDAIAIRQQRLAGKTAQWQNEVVDGVELKKELKFVTPDREESDKVLDLWDRIFNGYLGTRDLSPRIYERGKQPASGQAMTQSDKYMRSKREERKIYLIRFENHMFDLIRWQSNKNPDNIQIPDDLIVEVDWQPDKIDFVNLRDKTAYYKDALDRNEFTVPQIIRLEKQDLSIEMATEIHQANRKYNAENGAYIENTGIKDIDIQDAEKEVTGEKELGNPIEKGSDSKGSFVRWGKSGTKYYYKPSNARSFENAKNKALKQGRAIKSNQ